MISVSINGKPETTVPKNLLYNNPPKQSGNCPKQ